MSNEHSSSSPFADPAITAVTDSAGTPLTNPGYTEDTELTLSGVAPANSVVLLFDNGVPIGSASVTINGTWGKSAIAELGEHRFTVRVTGGPESLPWVITVETIAVPPTIFNVVDSRGDVAHNGTTFDTTVTVSGTGERGKAVEFFQDGNSKGDTPVNAEGAWSQSVTDLTPGGHNFQVRARYGSNPVSNIRSLIAEAATAPTIESIKDDADIEIPAGGTTFSTSVTLTGTAVEGQQVEVYDGTTLKGTVSATTGTWTLPLSELEVKAYSFKSRGLYGSNPESAERTFTVANAELIIDTSPVTLSGIAYGLIWVPENPVIVPAVPAPGTSVQREATGGAPPYRYRSANTSIVRVDEATGLVRALSNGSASIIVSDVHNVEKAYQVTVTNAWHFETFAVGTYQDVMSQLPSGWHIPSVSEFSAMDNDFRGSWPWQFYYFLTNVVSGNQALEFGIPGGAQKYRPLTSLFYAGGLSR